MTTIPALAVPPTLSPAEVEAIREARDFLRECADRLGFEDGVQALHLGRKLAAIARKFDGAEKR